MKCWWSVFFLFVCLRSVSQTQTCPVNINFANTDLTHWFAYTGNNANGNGPEAIMVNMIRLHPHPMEPRAPIQLLNIIWVLYSEFRFLPPAPLTHLAVFQPFLLLTGITTDIQLNWDPLPLPVEPAPTIWEAVVM